MVEMGTLHPSKESDRYKYLWTLDLPSNPMTLQYSPDDNLLACGLFDGSIFV